MVESKTDKKDKQTVSGLVNSQRIAKLLNKQMPANTIASFDETRPVGKGLFMVRSIILSYFTSRICLSVTEAPDNKNPPAINIKKGSHCTCPSVANRYPKAHEKATNAESLAFSSSTKAQSFAAGLTSYTEVCIRTSGFVV